MIGIGTIINTAAIIIGGLFGLLFGHFLKEKHQVALNSACGVSVLFIGVSGAMSGMLKINQYSLETAHAMLLTICLAFGALVGEIIDIERLFERFGEWLKGKTGNAKDSQFVNGFVSASLTVSIGAMAVIGSIQDGINHDWSILATKAVLDFIIVMIMTCTFGKGCMFSALPVFIVEGLMTLLSASLRNIMTDTALVFLSLTGSVLIFCVGINLLFGKRIKVANFLPALLFAVIASYLPIKL